MRIHIPIILLASASIALASGKIAVVNHDAIDFGKYPAREKKVATYTVRNVGKDTLKILKVRKTCGCASCSQFMASGSLVMARTLVPWQPLARAWLMVCGTACN